jgi:hypothetical protein
MTTPNQSGPKVQHADYKSPAQVILDLFSNDVQPYNRMMFPKNVIDDGYIAQDLTRLSLGDGATLLFFDHPDEDDYLLKVAERLIDRIKRARA